MRGKVRASAAFMKDSKLHPRFRTAFALAALLTLAGTVSQPRPAIAAFPFGDRQETAELNRMPLQIFTYRPQGCALSGVLIVFHGLDRNAADYRAYATPLAQRLCRLVIAPLFDKVRFPTWQYQRGGLVHDGKLRREADWTVGFVPRLVEWVRQRQAQPDLPYALLGHSAGAQFLSRVAAFAAMDQANQIVIANPSTWVRPSLDVAAPYGLGGVYTGARAQAALKRYLAQPITVLLGQDDVKSKNLATSEEAEDQGATRIDRGETVYREAQQAARVLGCPFNWRLAVVPGVGHDARAMFASEQAASALQR